MGRKIAVLLLLLGLCPLQGEDWDWELVYPEEYPTVEDLILWSIGVKHDIEKIETQNPEFETVYYDGYLVGSRHGHAYAGFTANDTDIEWKAVKLPVSFNITAVGVVDSHWIIGGSNGMIGIHRRQGSEFQRDTQGPYQPVDPHVSITREWETSHIGTDATVTDFTTLADTIFGLAGNQLYRSDNVGVSWDKAAYNADIPFRIFDIVTFAERIWMIALNEETTAVELLCSADGSEWELAWEIPTTLDQPYNITGKLAVIRESDIGKDRLYVHMATVEKNDEGQYDDFLGFFSTVDGSTWLDNGSYQINRTVEYEFFMHEWIPKQVSTEAPWNPLSIPESLQNARGIGLPEGIYAGNRRIVGSRFLQRNEDANWIEELSTYPWSKLDAKCNTNWVKLGFAFEKYPDQSKFVSIEQDGSIHETSIAATILQNSNITRLVNHSGTYNADIGGTIYMSDDLLNWSIIPEFEWDRPTGPRTITPNSSDKITLSDYSLSVQHDERTKLVIWENNSWSEPYLVHADTLDIEEVPHGSHWYSMRLDGESVILEELVQSDTALPVAQIHPESWNGYFTELASPDGKHVIAYGDSAEMIVIDPSGEVRQAHPWKLFPPDDYRIENILSANDRFFIHGSVDLMTKDFISFEPLPLPDPDFEIASIKFINGWYYFIGDPNSIMRGYDIVSSDFTYRTRDFMEYEKLPLPFDEPLIDLIEMNGSIYGFTEFAVFRQSQEAGYLNSYEHELGWHHSSWLGWFQIVNQETDDIDHLLLGQCWVKKLNDEQYWLLTTTLGWIYIYKDWSPWLFRMEDGHWYWLDQKYWPPRAWDSVDQEWEELTF